MYWLEWEEGKTSGSNIAEVPVTFSSDNKKAFVVSNNDMIVVDVESGRRQQVLSHPTNIVSVHYEFPGKVVTYTADGTERVWSTDTWLVMHCRELNCTPISVWHTEETTLLITKSDKMEFVVTQISEREELLQKKELLRTGPHNTSFSQHAFTADYLVCCEKLFVYLYFYGETEVKRFKYIGEAKFMDSSLLEFITVAACNDTVAAAISFGRVFIWNNVRQKGIGAFSRSVHWHKWAPCLVLTKSGTLFSGGVEGVLAKFALSESKSVGKPQLLPRLQAPIQRLSISEDGTIVAVVLSDNSAHFVLNSTLNVLGSMESILYSTKKSLFPLTEDPCNPGYVVHSARPGFIQWIDPLTMISVATADISRENPVEAENIFSDTTGYTDVCGIALSQTMAVTADCDVGFDVPSNRLQFWRRNEDLGSFALEYCELYGDTSVKFIRASLETDLFITVDAKGILCTWERTEGNGRKWYKSNEVSWMDVPVSHVSRIQNAHFAAVHNISQNDEGIVALWRVEHAKPPHVVHIHQGDGKLEAVEWGAPENAHLLIVASKSCIYALNICTLAPLWIACESDLKLAVTSQFTVAWSKNVISVIDSSSGTLHCQRKLKSVPESVLAIGKDERFAVIVAYQKGYGIIARSSLLNQAKKQICARSTTSKKTPFSNLLDVHNYNEFENKEVAVETVSNLEILSGPAYALAPVPFLAQKFIHSCFLPPRRLQRF